MPNEGLKTQLHGYLQNHYDLNIPFVSESGMVMFRFEHREKVCRVLLESGEQQIPTEAAGGRGHPLIMVSEFMTDAFDAMVSSATLHHRLQVQLPRGECISAISNHVDDCYGDSIVFTFSFAAPNARPQIVIPVTKGFFR